MDELKPTLHCRSRIKTQIIHSSLPKLTIIADPPKTKPSIIPSLRNSYSLAQNNAPNDNSNQDQSN